MVAIGAILGVCIFSLYIIASNKITSLGWGAVRTPYPLCIEQN
jgi:hypothetical protein